jgi:hypothetical protein
MAEPIEGTKATEKEIDDLMANLGYPQSQTAPKHVEETEESKLLDDLFRNLGI